jgi:hypothetical protein
MMGCMLILRRGGLELLCGVFRDVGVYMSCMQKYDLPTLSLTHLFFPRQLENMP